MHLRHVIYPVYCPLKFAFQFFHNQFLDLKNVSFRTCSLVVQHHIGSVDVLQFVSRDNDLFLTCGSYHFTVQTVVEQCYAGQKMTLRLKIALTDMASTVIYINVENTPMRKGDLNFRKFMVMFAAI